MKDYVTQPDRIVNVKNALEATVTPAERRTADRRGDEDGRPRRARRRRSACIRRSPRRPIEVGTPQIRNQGTVGGNLNQRPRCWYFRNEEFVCFKKGGNTVLLDRRREPVPRHLRRRPELHRASVEPGGAVGGLRRDVPPARPEGRAAGAGRGLLHAADDAERADRERAGARRAPDARDPAGARQREERALRGALQDVARLADRVRDRAAGDERRRRCGRRAS